MRFKTEDEIFRIINLFEAAILPNEEWRHAEHLLMAMFYSLNNDFDSALTKMRDGINKLNEFHGVVTTLERGYHETLTVFWVKTVYEHVETDRSKKILNLANEIIEKFDTNYPLRIYSRERLFSVEARFEFVEPDLENIRF